MRRRLLGGIAGVALLLVLAPWSPGEASTGRFELNIGSLAPRGTPWMDTLAQIERQIETDSGGRIDVVLRPPGVMSEVEMVRETRRGERLQGTGVTTAAIAEGGNVPQLQLLELPFLFDSDAEADHVLDRVLWKPMSDLLARRGFVLCAWSENGWRSFATRRSPVRTPQDLKRFKMRAQESAVHLEMYRAFGAQAVQKPMTEVLTALQSQVVDGLDNTALYIQAGGLAEPLDFFTVSRHIYQPAAIVWSKRWFDTLPADLKEVVLRPRALTAEARKRIRAEEAAMMENFAVFDVTVVELRPEERAAFAEIARGIHRPFAATIEGGPELLATIETALKEIRAR